MTNWMEELLKSVELEQEQRRLEMNRIRADEALGAIAVLEAEIETIDSTCDEEIRLIEEYRVRQTEKLNKRISWLAWNLEQYIRTTGLKTVELPRGELRLRAGRPKVEVVDMEAFMKVAERKGLLRTKPAEKAPDHAAILNYVKIYQTPPAGCALTPATVNFSYRTKGTNNGERERSETEAGTPAEQPDQAQAAA